MPVGRTRAAGWQVGVRRAWPGAVDEAWRLLLSPRGLRQWLGGSGRVRVEAGRTYRLANGTVGEWRVVKPGEVVRLTWQPAGWAAPSTLQLRVAPRARGLASIAIHQEKLGGPAERQAMLAHWQRTLAVLGCDD